MPPGKRGHRAPGEGCVVDRVDLRDWAPPTGDRRLTRPWRSRVLTAAVLAAAVAVPVAGLALTGQRPVGWTSAGPAFWLVAALVVLAELRPPARAAGRDLPGATATTTLVLAVLLHWGPVAAVLLQAAGALLAGLRQGRGLERTASDVARRTVGWAAAYGVLALVAQDFSGATPSLAAARPFGAADLLVALVAGATSLAVSTGLAAMGVAWRTGTSIRSQVRDATTSHWATAGSLLALAPLVVLAAERSAVLVPLVAVPLYWVHRETRATVERRRLLRHDALTGLANRAQLLERAAVALSAPGRAGHGQHGEASPGRAALLLLDLDRFRETTGQIGLAAGDALLREVAARLSTAVGVPDTVARTGGDEFALLLPGAGEREALAVAGRVAALLDGPFSLPGGRLAGAVLDGSLHARSVLDGAELDLHASVGIALAPHHATDVGTLLRRAERALRTAKELGVEVLVHGAVGPPATAPAPTASTDPAGDSGTGADAGAAVDHREPSGAA